MVVCDNSERMPCEECGASRTEQSRSFRYCEVCLRVRELAAVLDDRAGLVLTLFRKRNGELTARLEGKGRLFYMPAAPLLSRQLLQVLDDDKHVRELLAYDAAPDAKAD